MSGQVMQDCSLILVLLEATGNLEALLRVFGRELFHSAFYGMGIARYIEVYGGRSVRV